MYIATVAIGRYGERMCLWSVFEAYIVKWSGLYVKGEGVGGERRLALKPDGEVFRLLG
jgi:hypothetical protein